MRRASDAVLDVVEGSALEVSVWRPKAVERGQPSRSSLVARVSHAGRRLELVTTHVDLRHLAHRMLRPFCVAFTVLNLRLNGKSSAQQRPAIILLDHDAHRHTLHDFGKFAGD